MKYRKKPVIVEAIQWFPCKSVAGVFCERPTTEPEQAFVVTIHGQQAWLSPGDWVITEPDGVHHYPCKPNVFTATYEAVDAAGSGKEQVT